jgi:dTDP-4-dehydrorhamnose reductase
MHFIITGMNGTVAPAVASHLARLGHRVTAWDRGQVPPDDSAAVERFVRDQSPDGVFHIATGSPDWAESIARSCAGAGIKLVHTGSVSVFGPHQSGPLGIETPPEADDDYGRYKREVEQRIWRANPQAIIGRLGWQIGRETGGNHMLDFLARTAAESGVIEASGAWFPSCAFLDDSAAGLAELMLERPAGLYQLEGNPGLSFFEIVGELNRLHGGNWQIRRNDSHVQDNRMRDDNISIRPITETFAAGR